MPGIPGLVIANAEQIAALTVADAPAVVRAVEAEAPRGPRVAVVDYHKGNLMSVARGLQAAGADAFVTDDPAQVEAASAAVIPGVGAFDDAMSFMRESGLGRAVEGLARRGVPLLGICLGMQVLFARGDEHAAPPAPGEEPAWVPGLGLLAGDVTRLPAVGVKVPHVGWNTACLTRTAARCPLFDGVPDETYFYFTHSYACAPEDGGVVTATTEHGVRFASAVWDGDALFGVQFHPEKSSEAGAAVLRNFVRLVAERAGVEPGGQAASPGAPTAPSSEPAALTALSDAPAAPTGAARPGSPEAPSASREGAVR